MSKNLIIIFTRNPELGKCKTRLAASIGDITALKIYKKLIEHTANCVQRIVADAVVFYTENIQLNDAWPDVHFQKEVQHEGDLGEKMQAAFEWGFSKGYNKICIIGSDLMDLESSDLIDAFEKLNTYDLVFGPAEDGGYYLMGMKKLYKEAFTKKKWSTPTVLQKTLQDLRGKSVYLLAMKNDIDTLDDLRKHTELLNYLSEEIRIELT